MSADLANPDLFTLAREFILLSMMAFGGANAALPEIHRLVIEHHQWMSAAVFSDLFAISQAAPGPNVLLISLIGLQIAGPAGFLTTTAAFCLPSSVLMFVFDGWWRKGGDAAWRSACEAAIGPFAAGLVLASSWLIAASLFAEPSHDLRTAWMPVLLTAVTAWLMLVRPWHPLWLIAAGAGLGVVGVV